MNPSDSSSPPTQPYSVASGRNNHNNHSNQQPLTNLALDSGGFNDQIGSLQMSTYAAAQQQAMAASGSSMMANGGDTAMMDQLLMLPMNMVSENDMISLDPQLSTVGDQFAALATSSPLTPMPNEEYGGHTALTPMPNEEYGGLGGGSTLAEFTKRRNWSQRILEELQDFLHVLTPQGKVVYASPSSKGLTGFGVEELIGKFITEFIHEDDMALYVLLLLSPVMMDFFFLFFKKEKS